LTEYKRPRRLKSIFGIEDDKPQPRREHFIWAFLAVVVLIGGLLAFVLLIPGQSPEDQEEAVSQEPEEPGDVVRQPDADEEKPEKPTPRITIKRPNDLLELIERDFRGFTKCPDFDSSREPNPLLTELARDFHASRLSLEEKILVASGVKNQKELDRKAASLRKAIASVVANTRAAGKGRKGQELARALRSSLHKGPLKHYRSRASHLPSVLKTGNYNCLAGTALYWLAAKELGLPVSAYTMKGHILPVIHLPEGPYLIESTSADIAPVMVFSRIADKIEERHNRDFIRTSVKELIDLARARALKGDLKTAGKLSRWAWELKEEFEQEGSKWDKINSGLSEVGQAALIALFLNNLSFDVKDPVLQARMFIAMLELFQQSKARRMVHGMIRYLQRITDLMVDRSGYDCAVEAVSYMIAKNRQVHLDLRLRDYRAQLFDRWAAAARGSGRKLAVRRAIEADPEHPLVKKIRHKYTAPESRK
jgi:hypothetical protein